MKTDHTKTAMTISSIITIITWLISITSWFLNGEIPLELSGLIRYAIILHCASFACYCCKTGYETYCMYRYKTPYNYKTKQDNYKNKHDIRRDIKQGGD